jgi:hypothetical protein
MQIERAIALAEEYQMTLTHTRDGQFELKFKGQHIEFLYPGQIAEMQEVDYRVYYLDAGIEPGSEYDHHMLDIAA